MFPFQRSRSSVEKSENSTIGNQEIILTNADALAGDSTGQHTGFIESMYNSPACRIECNRGLVIFQKHIDTLIRVNIDGGADGRAPSAIPSTGCRKFDHFSQLRTDWRIHT